MYQNSIYKRALLLAVPMMIQNAITNMVGLVDNVMVGSLGTEAITAVSIVGQLIFVFNLAIFGGMSGPGIYAAQYYGKGDMVGFQHTFRMKHWIAGACVLLGMLVLFLQGEALTNLYLHGESASISSTGTMQYAMQYLHIMLISLPLFAITQVYASTLRESGDSVLPMIAGICSVVVDIVGNYLLIYGKFGCPQLGVRGAAAATVMARALEFVVVFLGALLQKRKYTFLQGVYRTFRIPGALAKKMVWRGLPIFLNEFLWAGSMAALTQCYSMRGLEIVAGLNISNAVCNLMNVAFIALGSAVGILIGQTLGACQYKQAEEDAFRLMWFTGGVCLVLSVVLFGISGWFPTFYETTPEVQRYATQFIRITAVFFPIQGFLNALYFTLRSGGKTLVTFLFDSVYSWVIVVTTAWVLTHFTAIPILWIYGIVLATDLIKLSIGYVLIRKGLWISNIVQTEAT